MTTGNAQIPAPTIDDVIVGLHRALTGNDPVVWTMLALDAIMQIAGTTDVELLNRAKLARVSELMTFVTPRLAEHVDCLIDTYRICFTFDAAHWLLRIRDDGLCFDRKLHVSLLASDLKSFLCRKRINERGDPLMRYARARQAWDAPRLPSASTQ